MKETSGRVFTICLKTLIIQEPRYRSNQIRHWWAKTWILFRLLSTRTLQPQRPFLAEWDKHLIALKSSVKIHFKPTKCTCAFKIWWIIQAGKYLQTQWGSIKWDRRLCRSHVYQTPTKLQAIWTMSLHSLTSPPLILQDRTTASHLILVKGKTKGLTVRIFFFWYSIYHMTLIYTDRSQLLAISFFCFAPSRWTLETGGI